VRAETSVTRGLAVAADPEHARKANCSRLLWKLRANLQDIIRANRAHLLIDCTGLKYIDSAGIAVLMEANRDLQKHGLHMLIANVAPEVRHPFQALGVRDLLRYDRTS